MSHKAASLMEAVKAESKGVEPLHKTPHRIRDAQRRSRGVGVGSVALSLPCQQLIVTNSLITSNQVIVISDSD